MSEWDTTEQLAKLRTRAAIPPNVLDADLLRLMNDVQKDKITPLLVEARKALLEMPVDTALVSGTAKYAVHSRAIGASPVDVNRVLSDGTLQKPPLAQVSSAELHELPQTTGSGPTHYYFEGDYIALWPTPGASAVPSTLRQRILLSPSKLVLPSAVGVITAVAGQVVTCSGGIPTAITSSTRVDLVKATPHFTRLVIDRSGTKAGNDFTFSGDALPSDLAVGDYLCLAGETPVPNYPETFHGTLIHNAAEQFLAKAGDQAGLKVEREQHGGESPASRVLSTVSPRGSPRRFVNRRW